MLKRLGQDARAAVIAAVTASVVAAPAAAAAVNYALNSDKVDNKHAVGSGTIAQKRAGKLVATNSSGRLPNNIIAKAPDTNKLDGQDSTAFLRVGGKAADADTLDGLDSSSLRVNGEVVKGPYVDVTTCTDARILSVPLTLTRPARIFASGSAAFGTSDGAMSPLIEVQLFDSTGIVVADTGQSQVPPTTTGVSLSVAEVLLDRNSNGAYNAPAGDYTLRIRAYIYGTCDGGAGTFFRPRLSYVQLAAE